MNVSAMKLISIILFLVCLPGKYFSQETGNLEKIGPVIFGIQLGENIQTSCDNFNKSHAKKLNGESLEVRQLAGDSTFVCSSPDGINAAKKIEAPANNVSHEEQLLGLLASVLTEGDGVIGGLFEAQMLKAPIFYADEDGRVKKIVLGTMAVHTLFEQSVFMSNKEFATFLHAKYKLPDLKGERVATKNPLTDQTEFLFKFYGFSADGYSIRIDETKAIFIEKM